VIFLDSWVWLEFLFEGEQEEEAFSLIQRANSSEEGGLITPLVLSEVGYRMRVEMGEETGQEAVETIRDHEYVESFPVGDDLAAYAAELRHDYYERRGCQISYADTVHLAAAIVHDDCHTFYTGDPDFEDVDEIKTVVL
jgi:predicted nucleic acid-binding protein